MNLSTQLNDKTFENEINYEESAKGINILKKQYEHSHNSILLQAHSKPLTGQVDALTANLDGILSENYLNLKENNITNSELNNEIILNNSKNPDKFSIDELHSASPADNDIQFSNLANNKQYPVNSPGEKTCFSNFTKEKSLLSNQRYEEEWKLTIADNPKYFSNSEASQENSNIIKDKEFFSGLLNNQFSPKNQTNLVDLIVTEHCFEKNEKCIIDQIPTENQCSLELKNEMINSKLDNNLFSLLENNVVSTSNLETEESNFENLENCISGLEKDKLSIIPPINNDVCSTDIVNTSTYSMNLTDDRQSSFDNKISQINECAAIVKYQKYQEKYLNLMKIQYFHILRANKHWNKSTENWAKLQNFFKNKKKFYSRLFCDKEEVSNQNDLKRHLKLNRVRGEGFVKLEFIIEPIPSSKPPEIIIRKFFEPKNIFFNYRETRVNFCCLKNVLRHFVITHPANDIKYKYIDNTYTESILNLNQKSSDKIKEIASSNTNLLIGVLTYSSIIASFVEPFGIKRIINFEIKLYPTTFSLSDECDQIAVGFIDGSIALYSIETGIQICIYQSDEHINKKITILKLFALEKKLYVVSSNESGATELTLISEYLSTKKLICFKICDGVYGEIFSIEFLPVDLQKIVEINFEERSNQLIDKNIIQSQSKNASTSIKHRYCAIGFKYTILIFELIPKCQYIYHFETNFHSNYDYQNSLSWGLCHVSTENEIKKKKTSVCLMIFTGDCAITLNFEYLLQISLSQVSAQHNFIYPTFFKLKSACAEVKQRFIIGFFLLCDILCGVIETRNLSKPINKQVKYSIAYISQKLFQQTSPKQGNISVTGLIEEGIWHDPILNLVQFKELTSYFNNSYQEKLIELETNELNAQINESNLNLTQFHKHDLQRIIFGSKIMKLITFDEKNYFLYFVGNCGEVLKKSILNFDKLLDLAIKKEEWKLGMMICYRLKKNKLPYMPSLPQNFKEIIITTNNRFHEQFRKLAKTFLKNQQLELLKREINSNLIMLFDFLFSVNESNYLFTKIYRVFQKKKLISLFMTNLEPFLMSKRIKIIESATILQTIIENIINYSESKDKAHILLENFILNCQFDGVILSTAEILLFDFEAYLPFIYLTSTIEKNTLKPAFKLLSSILSEDTLSPRLNKLIVIFIWYIDLCFRGKLYPFYDMHDILYENTFLDLIILVMQEDILKILLDKEPELFLDVLLLIFEDKQHNIIAKHSHEFTIKKKKLDMKSLTQLNSMSLDNADLIYSSIINQVYENFSLVINIKKTELNKQINIINIKKEIIRLQSVVYLWMLTISSIRSLNISVEHFINSIIFLLNNFSFYQEWTINKRLLHKSDYVRDYLLINDFNVNERKIQALNHLVLYVLHQSQDTNILHCFKHFLDEIPESYIIQITLLQFLGEYNTILVLYLEHHDPQVFNWLEKNIDNILSDTKQQLFIELLIKNVNKLLQIDASLTEKIFNSLSKFITIENVIQLLDKEPQLQLSYLQSLAQRCLGEAKKNHIILPIPVDIKILFVKLLCQYKQNTVKKYLKQYEFPWAQVKKKCKKFLNVDGLVTITLLEQEDGYLIIALQLYLKEIKKEILDINHKMIDQPDLVSFQKLFQLIKKAVKICKHDLSSKVIIKTFFNYLLQIKQGTLWIKLYKKLFKWWESGTSNTQYPYHGVLNKLKLRVLTFVLYEQVDILNTHRVFLKIDDFFANFNEFRKLFINLFKKVNYGKKLYKLFVISQKNITLILLSIFDTILYQLLFKFHLDLFFFFQSKTSIQAPVCDGCFQKLSVFDEHLIQYSCNHLYHKECNQKMIDSFLSSRNLLNYCPDCYSQDEPKIKEFFMHNILTANVIYSAIFIQDAVIEASPDSIKILSLEARLAKKKQNNQLQRLMEYEEKKENQQKSFFDFQNTLNNSFFYSYNDN